MYFFFFFNDTATTEIYTLSLHDALPILRQLAYAGLTGPDGRPERPWHPVRGDRDASMLWYAVMRDRKSTRLNSSHLVISYAVFCLKKKKHTTRPASRSAPPLRTSVSIRT